MRLQANALIEPRGKIQITSAMRVYEDLSTASCQTCSMSHWPVHVNAQRRSTLLRLVCDRWNPLTLLPTRWSVTYTPNPSNSRRV